ncbi:hypothetical protein JKP88DRAFT_275200 [Tribonema minus]|uniref:N-acetyltransferase domain-containing protein n=1 Tax=Tribonema minus TaxID=303371 RepID=A0A836CNZ2_9STRA|nr:hypothetical protein JKP88DRAFT_275200 [Tribonema minus]
MVLDEGAEVVGHGAILPPQGGQANPSLLVLLRLGLWKMPFVVGWGACARFLALLDVIAAIEHEVTSADADLNSGNYYTIEAYCVAVDRHGRGLGARMLPPLLARADAARRPAFLLTQLAGNVRFYARHGFAVIDERDAELKGAPFHCWAMKRLPAAAAAAAAVLSAAVS